MGALGIPQMILILAMLGFALAKQGWIRVILSLCLIVWGAFAIPIDVKIGAPLVSIAAVLFFMGTFKLIQNAREEGI